MSIADHPIITERYFFPMEVPLADPHLVDVGEATLACHYADGGYDQTVVHFHGNGEVVADYLPGFVHQLHQLGANAFFAEYRGYGGSTGTPMLGAMLDDVSAIRDALDVDDDQIVVFGRSIGSIYAIEFAARHPEIAGLVVESGIADVLERILLRARPSELGTTLEALKADFGTLFDHRRKLQSYSGPSLFMHADRDHLVDVSHAERNAEWAGEEAKLVVFDKGDHNTIFHANREVYLAELAQFLEDCRQ